MIFQFRTTANGQWSSTSLSILVVSFGVRRILSYELVTFRKKFVQAHRQAVSLSMSPRFEFPLTLNPLSCVFDTLARVGRSCDVISNVSFQIASHYFEEQWRNVRVRVNFKRSHPGRRESLADKREVEAWLADLWKGLTNRRPSRRRIRPDMVLVGPVGNHPGDRPSFRMGPPRCMVADPSSPAPRETLRTTTKEKIQKKEKAIITCYVW